MDFLKTKYEVTNNFCVPDSNEKDMIISNLKNKLFQLEESEKNYSDLMSKYRRLDSEYQLLQESKIRLEYELKQKTEQNNQIISQLRTQNENIYNEINDKDYTNKRLINDNNNIFKQIEDKKFEYGTLLNKVNGNETAINQLTIDKTEGEQKIETLKNTMNQNESNINNLTKELENLKQVTKDLNDNIKNTTNDLINHQKELDDIKFDNEDLNDQLKGKENNLDLTQKNLDLANQHLFQMTTDYRNINETIDIERKKIFELQKNFDNEKALRGAAETNNKKLEELLHEKNDELNNISLMNKSLKDNLNHAQNSNKKLSDDGERYKNYIMILNEQTQKLTDQLENIVEEDDKIFESIVQTDKLKKFVNEQKSILNDIIETSAEFLASDLNCSPTYKNYVSCNEC